jgi:hypothetical protein
VLHSESSRDALVGAPASDGSLDFSLAWSRVLLPTVAMWGELVRFGLAAGLCTDSQILSLDSQGIAAVVKRWPAMVTPHEDSLTQDVASAVARYESVGGVVIRLESAGWETSVSRRRLGDDVVGTLNSSRAGLGPVTRAVAASDDNGNVLHTTVMKSESEKLVSVVFLVNNFTTCTPNPHPPHPPPVGPAPATGVTVDIAPPSSSAGALVSAVDLITGQTLTAGEG